MWEIQNMCKRGHSDWHQVKYAGKKRKRCDYIMGYKMRGDSRTKVIFCGDLKKGAKLPATYIPLAEVGL